MKAFHIGIRIEDIEQIGPNGGANKATYPTLYTLRSGRTVSSTGTWQENVAAIERAISAHDSERRDLERIRLEIAAERAALLRLQGEAGAAARYTGARLDQGAAAKIAGVIKRVEARNNKYITAAEREELWNALEGLTK